MDTNLRIRADALGLRAETYEGGRVQIDDQDYEAVKISYNDGIGASPDDYYIIHLDPKTYQLKVLLDTAL